MYAARSRGDQAGGESIGRLFHRDAVQARWEDSVDQQKENISWRHGP